ncbi:hypothetical protein EJ03DRAFT_60620 [Teratosphaeria nubilosa]|uniref:Uncharacterized protein n=1 Tax=Teratosphaeria nubilosa TaxID=161662 RepID=A0A6G1LES2_9PEZI|nr:hypothetical protein EJ03DRAFT_60620 [Teratosphaeria nubilosa]
MTSYAWPHGYESHLLGRIARLLLAVEDLCSHWPLFLLAICYFTTAILNSIANAR